MKPPTDQARLARAFSVPPTKRVAAISISSTFAVIGALGVTMAFVPAVGLLAGLGAFAVGDRRAVRTGLRELESWGLPFEGYRAWLLASEPAFDVELRRAVSFDVLQASIAAVDPAVELRRIGDRQFRLVTRRIAVPDHRSAAPPIFLGDRRLLRELIERILLPLQTDVGVVSVRMGDRAQLATASPRALPEASPENPFGDGEGAFRDPAMVAPPALQALVLQGATTLSVNDDVRALSNRSDRVLYAIGKAPARLGTVLGIGLAGVFSLARFGAIGMTAGAIGGVAAGIAAVVGTKRRNLRAVATLATTVGFPIDGYDAWLISGRPLFELELQPPVEAAELTEALRAIVAFSAEANAPVRWIENITWVTPTIVRIETRPALIQPSTSRIRPFYGGSHVLFEQCLADVLRPWHARRGIVALRMGGNVERRI